MNYLHFKYSYLWKHTVNSWFRCWYICYFGLLRKLILYVFIMNLILLLKWYFSLLTLLNLTIFNFLATEIIWLLYFLFVLTSLQCINSIIGYQTWFSWARLNFTHIFVLNPELSNIWLSLILVEFNNFFIVFGKKPYSRFIWITRNNFVLPLIVLIFY